MLCWDPIDENALRAALEGYISPEEYLNLVLELYNFFQRLQESQAKHKRVGAGKAIVVFF